MRVCEEFKDMKVCVAGHMYKNKLLFVRKWSLSACNVLCVGAADMNFLFLHSNGAGNFFPRSLCGPLTQPAERLLVHQTRRHSEVENSYTQ